MNDRGVTALGINGFLFILSTLLFITCVFQVMGWFACICFIVFLMTFTLFNTAVFAPHLLPKQYQTREARRFLSGELEKIQKRNGTL